jgi:hypothetical protein
MAGSVNSEFAIELVFTKRRNGRCYVHSPSIPGLHLAGSDLELIRADIEPSVKDLLLHNSGIVVDQIRWVPSLEQITQSIKDDTPPSQPPPGKPTYLVIVGRAP